VVAFVSGSHEVARAADDYSGIPRQEILMRSRVSFPLSIMAFGGLLFVALSMTQAQQGTSGKKGGSRSAETAADFVNRLMSFNKAKDGKLTKEELTDKRLHALFDRADTDKDGVVTKKELEALFARETTAGGDGDFGPGGDGPKGKKGGKGKGPGGFGGPPQPGQILPSFLQEVLKLTDAQRKEVLDLQKDVDTKLAKILTDDQRQRLRDLRENGPGGFGPPPFGEKKGAPPGDRR